MEQTLWTTRKFNFDFPAGLFPVIICRLQGSIPRIKELVMGLDHADLIKQPDGKWSIQEHIGHLIDLEELHSQRIVDFRNHAATLSAWDGVNKKTEEAHHNSKSIDKLINEFMHVRNQFIRDLLTFNDEEISRTAIHPRLNVQMRVVDMAYFVAEHDDHHIAKIWELKRNADDND